MVDDRAQMRSFETGAFKTRLARPFATSMLIIRKEDSKVMVQLNNWNLLAVDKVGKGNSRVRKSQSSPVGLIEINTISNDPIK